VLTLDELGPKLVLELSDLHRQGWLADRAFLSGAPEVAVASQCIEIAQLGEGQHHKIFDRGTGIFGSAPAACRSAMQRIMSKMSTNVSTKSTISWVRSTMLVI
jgi:hypothetical protein